MITSEIAVDTINTGGNFEKYSGSAVYTTSFSKILVTLTPFWLVPKVLAWLDSSLPTQCTKKNFQSSKLMASVTGKVPYSVHTSVTPWEKGIRTVAITDFIDDFTGWRIGNTKSGRVTNKQSAGEHTNSNRQGATLEECPKNVPMEIIEGGSQK